MGAAYFIVLERDIPGFDPYVSGKALACFMDALDERARRLGVQPLSAFYSAAPENLAAFVEAEGVAIEALALPPLQQFSAEEGLAAVQAIAPHFLHEAELAQDLSDCERVLIKAVQHRVAWHFEVDF